MNISDSHVERPRVNFRGVSKCRTLYSDRDLAAIGRAAHALKRREPVSMTGAVIIAGAVLIGIALAAGLCQSLGVPFDSPIAWLLLTLPIVLIASIILVSSRRDRAMDDRAIAILLDAGLCGTCAAPLASGARVDRTTCAECNTPWTLPPDAPRRAERPTPTPTRSDPVLLLLDAMALWQRDALGTRVPSAAAFADAILTSSSDESIRARRHAVLGSLARDVRTNMRVFRFAFVGLLVSCVAYFTGSGMLTGLAVASLIASVLAIVVSRISRTTTAREARTALLGVRLCPCCADDLDAKGHIDWQGQPMIRCDACLGVWYMNPSDVTYRPQPGSSTCRRCGYALAGLTADERAMVMCPECSRRCPVPGHASCPVCDTALLFDAKQLYRGVICPTCKMVNRIGVKGIELD